MKFSRILTTSLVSLALLAQLGCDSGDSQKVAQTQANTQEVIKAGVCPGPYRSLIEKFIKPELLERGYKVEVVEFTDYIQPNSALDGGDIQFNLMQHQTYLDNIVKEQGLKIKAVINVPTLGLGIFSDKYKSLDEVQDGAKVGVPNDAVNLARALRIASEFKLITLKTLNKEQKASIADIGENPLHLEFIPMEAAQISRSLDSLDLGFVPGNYAYASGLDYSKSLGVESVQEDIKNVLAVKSDEEKLDKVLLEIVKSEDFKKALNADKDFDAFSRPQWWNK